MFNGQAAQDLFVLKALDNKQNGTFVEIGSNDPIKINNSYPLEINHNWRGIMVEMDPKFLESYKKIRPASNYIIADATTVNFNKVFQETNIPKNIDYLQIDLDVNTKSTLTTLQNLDSQVMKDYTFSVVTFEHDIYRGNYFNTKQLSRDVFLKHGYILVYPDVQNKHNPFEDWYVHPQFVSQEFINKHKTNESLEYTEIVKRLTN